MGMANDEIELLELDPPVTTKRKKHLKLNAKVIVAILIVLLLLCVSLVFTHNHKGKISYDSYAFFIKNNDNLYAIFNNSGNKLSGFNFKQVDNYMYSSAVVVDTKDKYHIISDKGEELVEKDKYTKITSKRGFYQARQKNVVFLLNNAGKEIVKLEDANNAIFYNIDGIVVVKNNDKFIVYNYLGKKIVSFKVSLEGDKPLIDSMGNYVIVYYDSVNYYIDIETGKLIKKIKDNQRYCMAEINEQDSSKVIIKSCMINESDAAVYNFKYLQSGKIVFEKNSDKLSDMSFSGNNIIYNTIDNKYLLDKKGNEALTLQDTQYIDTANYAKLLEDGGAIELYKEGKLRNSSPCGYLQTKYANQNIYLLEKCDALIEGYFSYYNRDTKKVGEHNYQKATAFDDNIRAIVSDEGKSAYLIDENGNKQSDEYVSIDKVSSYYAGINNVGKVFILDKNGKVLVKGDSYIVKEFKKVSLLLVKKKKKYIMYNLNNIKKIATVKTVPSLEQDYYSVTNNGKVSYYSYENGKLIVTL